MRKAIQFKFIVLVGISIGSLLLLVSCGSGKIPTPEDTKYLEMFHLVNFESSKENLQSDQLKLFVDNSTCIALGQHSDFFQDISAPFINSVTEYYSIKGADIVKEDLSKNDAVYSLLRNIKEVNYANLPEAAKRMASSNCESVLITDGEYYTPSIAKGHENDPYLAKPFRDWLLKGHDIHIISEPYEEPYKGKTFKKKRFYIIFTDDELEGNVYDRIINTVKFEKYPQIDVFHISSSHTKLFGDGTNCSIQNPILGSKSFGKGTYEIEDWNDANWDNIGDLIVNAVNQNTGAELENGEPIISMSIDKNSFGCFRIKSLCLKVYDINQEYADFYELKGKSSGNNFQLVELENFMLIDKAKFEKHSQIDIHFNKDWFDPSILTGDPFNYFKVDISIGSVESIFERHESNFEFESIECPDQMNVSVASSIKQCLADPQLKDMMIGQVIYSIYIKSEKQ